MHASAKIWQTKSPRGTQPMGSWPGRYRYYKACSSYPLSCQDIQSRLKCPALTHLGNWEEIYTEVLASITAILRSTDFEVF